MIRRSPSSASLVVTFARNELALSLVAIPRRSLPESQSSAHFYTLTVTSVVPGTMRSLLIPKLCCLLFAAICVAAPGAQPDAEADAEPQITNNAPFSGAVYLVNPNGEQVTTQDTNYCPASVSQSCSSVNAPSWWVAITDTYVDL